MQIACNYLIGATQMADFDRLACITIQGGGVYGLNLLGQLRAVEDLRFKPVALAGTSAGAIVATLFWARLSSDQVCKEFETLAESPNALTDLVGPFQGDDGLNFDVGHLRGMTDRVKDYLVEFQRIIKARGNQSVWTRWLTWLASIAHLRGVTSDLSIGQRLWKRRGVFPGRNLQDYFDKLLRKSPILSQEQNKKILSDRGANNRWLTFGDIRKLESDGSDGNEKGLYFPPLFLAATNLTTRSLELINSVQDKYQDWPIVKAVMASAAFPVFFRPINQDYDDGEYSFVDGGVIANFPAFVFAGGFRELLAEYKPRSAAILIRPFIHIGLRLAARKRSRGFAGESQDPGAFLQAMKELMVSQARRVLEDEVARFVPRSITVDVPFEETGGPDGVLNIEAIRPETVRQMYHNGREATAQVFRKLSFELPQPKPIEDYLGNLVNQTKPLFGGDPDGTRLSLRSNVFILQDDDLVLNYRFNMDDPPNVSPDQIKNKDKELRFNYRCGLTGFCFVRRVPLICNLKKFGELFATGSLFDPRERFGFDERMQGKIREDRTWLMSLPIFDPEASSVRKLRIDLPELADYSGQHYVELESLLDGAVFGVLNLDAGWDYNQIGLSEEPEEHQRDYRILALLDIMRSYAFRIAKEFSSAFPRRIMG